MFGSNKWSLRYLGSKNGFRISTSKTAGFGSQNAVSGEKMVFRPKICCLGLSRRYGRKMFFRSEKMGFSSIKRCVGSKMIVG